MADKLILLGLVALPTLLNIAFLELLRPFFFSASPGKLKVTAIIVASLILPMVYFVVTPLIFNGFPPDMMELVSKGSLHGISAFLAYALGALYLAKRSVKGTGERSS